MGSWVVWLARDVALAGEEDVLKGWDGGNAEDCGAGGVVLLVVEEDMV
jgi:hypothetical protein